MKVASYTRSNLKPVPPPSKVAPASGVSAAAAPPSGMASKDACLASYHDHLGKIVNLAVITEDGKIVKDKPVEKSDKSASVVAPAHAEVSGYTVAGLTAGGVLVDISHVAHLTVASDDPNLVNCSVDGMMFNVHVNPTLTDPIAAVVMVRATVYWTDPELSARSALGACAKIGVPITLKVHSKVVDVYCEAGMPREL